MKPREVVSVYGQCRVMLTDEERGEMDKQKIQDSEDVTETVFTKSTTQHDVNAEDSDEEEGQIADIVSQETVEVEEVTPPPKKKVVKKKVVAATEEETEEATPPPKKKVVKKKKVVAAEEA